MNAVQPAPGEAPRRARPATRESLVRALGRTRDPRARAELLVRSTHLHDERLVHGLHEAAVRTAHADLGRAERLADAARWLADRLGHDRARATSLRTAGHMLSLRGRHRQALARYREALALLASPSDDLERAITLSGALQMLIYVGDYDQAHACADQARRILADRGDDLRLGRLDINVGNVYYRQDRFREALACYRRGHAALARAAVPEDVAVVLRNMAVCWISLNDFSAALEAYREARSWCDRHGLARLAAETDYNVAYLHYLRGEYARAIELYRATREHCQRVGDRYHQALCDLDQSEIFLELNLDEEAGRMAAQARRAFRALHMRYELGKALVNMGASAARAGEGGRALALFEDARAVFSQEGNRHWLTITSLYRALVLSDEGDLTAARRLCRSALSYFDRQGPPGKAALSELLLARLDFRAGRLQQAKAIAERAIVRAEAGEAAALAAQGYLVLGEIHEALGDDEAAYAAFRQAHAGLETLRSHITGEQLKIAFLEDKLAVYEGLVALALEREPPILRARVAFRYIEQAKSRSLADLMAFGPPPPVSERNAKTARRVADLRNELTWWLRKVDASPSAPGNGTGAREAAAARRRARDCEVRLVRAQAELDQADAELRALGSGGVLPPDAIRSALPADTALVEYYQARGRILACVLTPERLEVVPLGRSARVRHALRLLQFQLSKFGVDEGYAARFAPELLSATLDHLHELHDALMAPILPLIGGRRLVVVPHRFLHYLPFHALYDGRSFLVDRVVLSYAPSATVYYLCRSRAGRSEPRSLVLGVPDPRAPHILDEIEAVSARLPAPSVFVGDAATDRRLREEGASARYVHVATHGFFRQDNPMFSAVRLGNGEMSLLDLYQLRLSADLVTLSGCGTGLSAVVGGDELVGLVRGLLFAGARSVLVTLWDVHDRSTAAFMRSFYGHLASGMDKGPALAAATRALRAEYPHPYYWAPFVLVGDPGGASPAGE